MICVVRPSHRSVLAGSALLTAACVLASCANSPTPSAAPTTTSSSTTTTTTAVPATLPQDVGVPNVVGMKIALARFYLRTAGFATVPFNAACSKGTLASQSVVASLSVPGRPPFVTVDATPLVPGTLLSKGSRVGITWSGCYPEGTVVPMLIGYTFSSAVRIVRRAGLDWACYSSGGPTTTTHPTTTTTTTTGPTTSSTASPTTSTTTPATTTTAKVPQTVLSQGIKAGTTVHAGTVVDLVMHHCPQ
jgi:beta-lactam-binding protein with PASTA domain